MTEKQKNWVVWKVPGEDLPDPIPDPSPENIICYGEDLQDAMDTATRLRYGSGYGSGYDGFTFVRPIFRQTDLQLPPDSHPA